jgi:hypothetical protein
MTLGGFLLACAAIGIPVALILILEWRSHPRDPKTRGLSAANSRPIEGEKK